MLLSDWTAKFLQWYKSRYSTSDVPLFRVEVGLRPTKTTPGQEIEPCLLLTVSHSFPLIKRNWVVPANLRGSICEWGGEFSKLTVIMITTRKMISKHNILTALHSERIFPADAT